MTQWCRTHKLTFKGQICLAPYFAPLCCAGNAYAARKNSPDKSWQQAAYTDEIAHLQEKDDSATAMESKSALESALPVPANA
jgi:hypothetical protein